MWLENLDVKFYQREVSVKAISNWMDKKVILSSEEARTVSSFFNTSFSSYSSYFSY